LTQSPEKSGLSILEDMMMKNISAVVKVKLEVEVTVGSWSPKETFEGLRKQAGREAKNRLTGLVGNSGCRVLSEPVALSVTLDGEL